MFRSKLLNICTVRKQLWPARVDSRNCGSRPVTRRSAALSASISLLFGLLSLGCGDVQQASSSSLEACRGFRSNLCRRYQQCLKKPLSWHTECLEHQEEEGGTCEAVVDSSPCLSSRADRVQECAEALLTKPCSTLCQDRADRVICSDTCEVVCALGNVIKL